MEAVLRSALWPGPLVVPLEFEAGTAPPRREGSGAARALRLDVELRGLPLLGWVRVAPWGPAPAVPWLGVAAGALGLLGLYFLLRGLTR